MNDKEARINALVHMIADAEELENTVINHYHYSRARHESRAYGEVPATQEEIILSRMSFQDAEKGMEEMRKVTRGFWELLSNELKGESPEYQKEVCERIEKIREEIHRKSHYCGY